MADPFDVVVIGAGPGGYIAAIRAAQLGFRTACIDDWTTADGKPAPGGTCTNVGCIPSKALLQSSENYEHAGHGFAEHGIEIKGLAVDLGRMLARKDKVVAQNNDGIVYLFKKNKVAFFTGVGSFAGGDRRRHGRSRSPDPMPPSLTAKHVIVATGSKPRALVVGGNALPFDNRLILDNDGALAISAVPKKLGVVGAGVIGLEMGSVWRRLGAEVTLLEALPAFLGAADEQVAKEAWKAFTKQGLTIELGVKITAVKPANDAVAVEYDDAPGAQAERALRPADRLHRPRSAHRRPRMRRRSGWRWTSAASSPSTATARPISPASGRSATSCAGRCSRTRPRRKAWRWPSASPASTGTSTSTPCPG